MAKHKTSKTNFELIRLKEALRASANQHQARVWKKLASMLEAPASSYAQVNLSRLNRSTNAGDVVVVPGRVLGAGAIEHPIRVGALGFSANARLKIIAAAGSIATIDEIVQALPKGSNIKIIR
jgi:large subunit ribosomal protein L18e